MRSGRWSTVIQNGLIAMIVPLTMGMRCVPGPGDGPGAGGHGGTGGLAGSRGGEGGGAAGSPAGGKSGSGGPGNGGSNEGTAGAGVAGVGGRSDAGAGGSTGGSGGGVGGGASAGSAGSAVGASGGSRVDGGIGPSCAGASPLDVWTTDVAREDIRGVFAVAPNDAWMTTSQHVQHWDGATWTNVPLNFDTSSLLGPVWASGADDVWVTANRLMRWNGTVWTDMAIPAAYAFPTVVGRGPNDVWAWTTQQTTQQIAHWDGSSWSDRSPLHDPLTSWIGIQALWLASADDVWLAGYGPSGVLVEHWNGARWELSPVTTTITSFTGMWGSSPTDIWLLGNRGMMHYDGISWTLADPTLKGAGGIWGSCASDVWAILEPIYSSRVAHFDGAKWSIIPLSGVQTTSLISGTGPDDVWLAAKYLVTIYHRHPGDPTAACGNGRLDPGEQCDPPDGIGCSSSCQRIPGCGDGVLEAGESCDPPDGLTCSTTCQPIPACGNGFIDPGEQCDPPHGGPGAPAPWCDATCQIPRCGNGVVDPGETCDPPKSWQPGNGGPMYCGNNCTMQNACTDCHTLCDPMSVPFAQCAQQFCNAGPYSPCG